MALSGARAYYQTEISGTYTENRLWNRTTYSSSVMADSQIASVTKASSFGSQYPIADALLAASVQYPGAYHTNYVEARAGENKTAGNSDISGVVIGCSWGRIYMYAYDLPIEVVQPTANGLIQGGLVQGRDDHIYSLQWDGSHCWLWVDVTRVGQIV